MTTNFLCGVSSSIWQPRDVWFWRLWGAWQRDHWQEGEQKTGIKYKTTLIQRGVMIIHPLEYLLLWTYVKTAKNRWLRLWIQRSCKSTETFSHFLTGHFEQDVESLGSKVNMFLATILCYVRNWIWSLWCSCRDGGGSIGEEELGKVMRTFGWDPKEEELKVPHPPSPPYFKLLLA